MLCLPWTAELFRLLLLWKESRTIICDCIGTANYRPNPAQIWADHLISKLRSSLFHLHTLPGMPISSGFYIWCQISTRSPGFWWRHKASLKGGPKLASKPKLPIGGLALGGAFMGESNFLDRHLVKFQHPPHHLAFAGFIVARLLHTTHSVRISFKMITKLSLS